MTLLLVVRCVSYRTCGHIRNCGGKWLLRTDPLVISLLLADTLFRKPDGQLLHIIAWWVDDTAISGCTLIVSKGNRRLICPDSVVRRYFMRKAMALLTALV